MNMIINHWEDPPSCIWGVEAAVLSITTATLARFQMLLSLAWGPSEAGRSETHHFYSGHQQGYIRKWGILSNGNIKYVYVCIYIYRGVSINGGYPNSWLV